MFSSRVFSRILFDIFNFGKKENIFKALEQMAKRRKKDMNFHNPLRICSEFLLLIYTSKNLSLQFIYPLFHFCNYISFNIFFTDTVLRERLPTLKQYDKVECTLFASVAPEHAWARKMPVRSQFLMLEHTRCSIFLMLDANEPLKIGKFWQK